MISKTLTCITAMMLFAALAIPVRLSAEENRDRHHKHHHYKLIDISTFGGPNSTVTGFEQVVNDRGMVAGGADTPTPDPACIGFNGMGDCFVSHAFKWQNGVLTDLGALPGINSSYANRISTNGLVAGISENGEMDPLIGIPELRAAFWNDAHIVDLGTLGGNESFGTAVNNRGQVVVLAANAIPDPFCYWRPAFGQSGAAAGHLINQGVMNEKSSHRAGGLDQDVRVDLTSAGSVL